VAFVLPDGGVLGLASASPEPWVWLCRAKCRGRSRARRRACRDGVAGRPYRPHSVRTSKAEVVELEVDLICDGRSVLHVENRPGRGRRAGARRRRRCRRCHRWRDLVRHLTSLALLASAFHGKQRGVARSPSRSFAAKTSWSPSIPALTAPECSRRSMDRRER
jgi:hypothetical protein